MLIDAGVWCVEDNARHSPGTFVPLIDLGRGMKGHEVAEADNTFLREWQVLMRYRSNLDETIC